MAFGITLSELFAEEDTPVSLTDSQSKLLERWSRLSAEQQAAVFVLIDKKNPLKAKQGEDLIPRKAGLDPNKYGCYNKTAAAAFLLTSYIHGRFNRMRIVRVRLVHLLCYMLFRNRNNLSGLYPQHHKCAII